MKKVKLNPDNKYLFINNQGSVVSLDAVSEKSYILEDKDTYIAVHWFGTDETIVATYVLYVQATMKDMH